MRPGRFEELLIEAAKQLPAVEDAVSLREAGHVNHPLGVAMRLVGGARVWWQVTAVSAPGDDYGTPEKPRVTGPAAALGPAATQTADQDGRWPLKVLEAALAAALVSVDSQAPEGAEIAVVGLLSQRSGKIPYGLAVDFHDQSRVFVNCLAVAGRGRQPAGGYFKVPAAI